MLSFESDYIEGAHPRIIEKLVETNMEQLSGYGMDCYTARAKEKIQKACGKDDAEVAFLVGGTQTNQFVIDTMLDICEGVIAAETGHVASHEGGAIEHTGHKVLTLPQKDGKIEPHVMADYLQRFFADENHTHMVIPGMVYISHPTEFGTLYTKDELTQLSEICHQYDMPLFLDGARLAYGLMSRETDVTLEDIAQLCDVFYIGGTKVGALCGEALVYTCDRVPKHFVTKVKQHGALLAKGRLLGIQFDTLFTDNLYLEMGKHAIDRAEELKAVFREFGYDFLIDSPTNQQFIILNNEEMENLKDKVAFCFWENVDEHRTAVRFATSWATSKENIEQLAKLLTKQV